MGDTKSIGIAYRDQDLTGSTLTDLLSVTVAGTSAATGSVDAVAISATETITGTGGVGFSVKGAQSVNVVAGAYLSALYGILTFGSSGRVTGLAAGATAEIVLSAATTAGTYAALDLEIGMPTGAVTAGTGTSFMYLSSYGADKATFDTTGNLFTLAGIAKGTGKLLQDTTSGATIRPVQALRVITPDGVRYLPLYSTVAIAA
jgi:hypothetical protein|tara:strand:- start:1188 stop:1796 length:609 start_codon:yes stop_codon:yes gene_type:complete